MPPPPVFSFLRILSWNCNSLQQKVDELRNFILQHPVDIILLQEVKTLNPKRIKIQNYTLYLTPRNVHGSAADVYGGTAIYVKNNITHSQLNPVNNIIIENTIVEIKIGSDKIKIVCIYARAGHHISDLEKELKDLINLDDKVILIGDYNAWHTHWGNSRNNSYGEKIFNICDMLNLDIISPDQPTRYGSNGRASFIDFGIFKNINLVSEASSICALSSDHNPIIFSLQINNFLPAINTPPIFNWEEYTRYLHHSPPPIRELNNAQDLEHSALLLNANIRQALQTAKTHPPTKYYHAFPPELRHLIRYKNHVRNTWQRTRDPLIKTNLNRLNLKVKNAVKSFKAESWENFISELTPDDNSLWRYVQEYQKGFSSPSPSGHAHRYLYRRK